MNSLLTDQHKNLLFVRLNRSAKYTLEQDLKEKSEAQHADLSCSLMPSHSPKLPPIIATAQQR